MKILRRKGVLCPGRAVLGEDGEVRPGHPHVVHESAAPDVRARSAEKDVLDSLPPKSFLREYVSRVYQKFEELGIDVQLMSKEGTLKQRLWRKGQTVPKNPSINSFFDLGTNSNDLIYTLHYIYIS